jgi:hypothetical protein
MTQLKIDLPDQVFKALQTEAKQRGEPLDTLIVHYLSLIKIMLMDKPAASKHWPDSFFEDTAGSWEGEPLEREPQDEYEERLEL